MQECNTNADETKVSYKWNILNFQDYIDVKHQKSDISINSTFFSLPMHKECKFWLRVEFPYEKWRQKECIECYLGWEDINDDTRIRHTLSILDSTNTKEIVSGFCTSITRKSAEGFGYEWLGNIKKELLLTNSATFLPNNILTLYCELTIYEGIPNSYDTKYVSKTDPTLPNPFKTLLDNPLHSDFTIDVGGVQFKVHKAFLIAQSPVFEAMFQCEMSEKINNYTKITDIRSDVFRIFLEYIYTNEMKAGLNLDDTASLLSAADKYQVDALKEKCYERLSAFINSGDAFYICLLALRYGNRELVKLARNFLR